MIYVLNKNKILSYMIASVIVISLFIFSAGTVQNDVEIVKVSSNVMNDNKNSVNNIIIINGYKNSN